MRNRESPAKRRRADDGYPVPLRWMVLIVILFCSACVKPALTAREQSLTPFERIYSADANQIYYAVRWALAATGYPVGVEDLQGGRISTTWVPSPAGAQFLDPFDRDEPTSRNWDNSSGYFRMDFQVLPEGGATRVVVTSRLRSVVAYLQSSGEQERRVLDKVGDYLRSADPDVTNVGIK